MSSLLLFFVNMLRDLESWTSFHDPSQIVIRYDRPEDVLVKPPKRVSLGGSESSPGKNSPTYFIKPFYTHKNPGRAKLELEASKKIAMKEGKLCPQARICHLHGVVRRGDRLLGILLTHVDCDSVGVLQYLSWQRPPDSRLRWAAQIRDTLAELHRNGLVWGDAKAHNVLVDRDDDAWIIDFGGSYTRGWVDEDRAGTVEGDLQGLGKILELLNDPSPARVISDDEA